MKNRPSIKSQKTILRDKKKSRRDKYPGSQGKGKLFKERRIVKGGRTPGEISAKQCLWDFATENSLVSLASVSVECWDQLPACGP